MLIKDLKKNYPLVYKAALANQNSQGNRADDSINLKHNNTLGGFNWGLGPEGYNFWFNIELQNFSKAKERCPHLFEPTSNTEDKSDRVEVVHCTTQEEWDYVSNKMNYTFSLQWRVNAEKSCINFKARETASLRFYKEKNVKIYSFQEWCDKFGHKPDFIKPKFEVGKWYKGWCEGDYTKFQKLESDCFYFTEKIQRRKHCKKSDWWGNHSGIEEASLEEIQEFLPDGHPDKFKTPNESEMTMKEIQQLCKEKYPIGCIYKDAQYEDSTTLLKDDTTYTLASVSNSVLAHNGGGCLYKEGKWAEIISTPTETKSEEKWFPKARDWVVRTVDKRGPHFKGKVFQINGVLKYDVIEDGGIHHSISSIRKAELHEIPKEKSNSPSFPTVALDVFPTEGAYNSLALLPYLKFVKKLRKIGTSEEKVAKGVGWNRETYWFMKGDITSSKTYYNYGQLQKFIKEGQSLQYSKSVKTVGHKDLSTTSILQGMTEGVWLEDNSILKYLSGNILVDNEIISSNPKKKSYETTVNLVTTDYQLKKKKKRSVLSI